MKIEKHGKLHDCKNNKNVIENLLTEKYENWIKKNVLVFEFTNNIKIVFFLLSWKRW